MTVATKSGQVKSRISIDGIARLAGVSKSTVSNTFSGRKFVNPEVRERIQEVAARMGYRPHYAAKVLATRKTMMIGVLVSELYNPNTSAIVQSFEQALLRRKYKMLLGLTYGSRERGIEYLEQFGTGMVDGIITTLPEVPFREAVRSSGTIPLMVWCSVAAGSPAILDHEAGINCALEHLWELGHRRIGMISLSSCVNVGPVSSESYVRFMNRKGMPVDESLLVGGDSHAQSGYQLGSVLWQRGATAIFARNDLMGFGVLKWAREAGVRVPEDLSVVGADDNPMATLVAPPLTTIQMPVDQLTELTVRGLIDQIEGRPPRQQELIIPRLIVRESTGPVSHP